MPKKVLLLFRIGARQAKRISYFYCAMQFIIKGILHFFTSKAFIFKFPRPELNRAYRQGGRVIIQRTFVLMLSL